MSTLELVKTTEGTGFTLSHELGHLVLRHSMAFARTDSRGAAWRPFEDSEWQANTFAAELLKPLLVLATVVVLAT
jgi:Zn-dependent peptidase ImmA (M78 family)